MLTLKKNQSGFGVIELFLIVVVVAVVIASAVYFLHNKKQPQTSEATTQTTTSSKSRPAAPVQWNYDDKKQAYVTSATPPACPQPLFAKSPVNTDLATSVLYPGQYRGMNYKPHGGFAFDSGVKATDIQVVMPMDGTVNGLVRYIESGEIQYKVSFINACGISIYFDHLYELSPALMEIAKTTSEPKVDDTRGNPLNTTVTLKAGDLVATAAGHPKTNNLGMDFGVLDLRQPNEISKNTTWAALHQQFRSSEWYGICWFDLLPAHDAARVKNLPSRDQKSGVRSDYCANTTGTTLDVNGGKPV